MEEQIVFPCHNLWGQICVGFIYSFSHSCLQAKGMQLTMAESIQNCCKLLTSAEMSHGDTNKNVLTEFWLFLIYCATNILTDGVGKAFCPFTFFSVWLISKAEEPLYFLGKFFSWHLLNVLYGRGPRHFFRGFEYCFKNNFSYEGSYILRSFLTSHSDSVNWDSFLAQVGRYNGHEEHLRT